VQVWILAAILAAALLGVLFYVLLQPNDDEDISPPR
jgi:K+-transporting ATPase KdpF subunit